MAFGTLTAACGDDITVREPQGVTNISVTPPSATVNVGESVTFAASVTADANTAKTVTWSSSNQAVATVDATGKVTGVSAGNTTIIATSTADASKQAAAAVTVTGGATPVTPSIAINGVTKGGVPVNLSGTSGQIDVTVNTSGGGLIEAFLSSDCSTNAIGANDTPIASQQATSAQPGTVTLSFNTAQLNTATNSPMFPNGAYCIKTRLTNGSTVVVATNTVPVTLANTNTATATVTFASQTGGPTSAVSDINGLNYNQGSLTLTFQPVIFTGSSPAALISGSFTRNGEQAGAGTTDVTFTNLAVTNGTATLVLPDTAGAAAGRSLYQYNSLPAGDTLYIVSATDAAGNPISFPGGAIAVTGAQGLRIDNQIPDTTGAVYQVLAPNAYIGAAYDFSSGTSGTDASDIVAGVEGVGGVTATYYVGPSTATGFKNANTCDVTGLTAGATGADLSNTTVTTTDRVKVVVSDKLGNQVCSDVDVVTSSGTLTGTAATFGVDKIAPTMRDTTANNGAADSTGYNTIKAFSFVYNDSISSFDPNTPLQGKLLRNFFANGSGAAADCVIGHYTASGKTCADTLLTITSTFGTPPNAGGSIDDFTGGTSTQGYYKLIASPLDKAGNLGTPDTLIVAYDITAPAIGALTQSPTSVASLGSVTVSGTATDNLDLATANGDLVFATAPAPIQGPAASSFGTLFDATLVKSATASVTLSNVYRSLQSLDGSNVVQANAAGPQATVTVTDVGGNSTTSGTTAITMDSAAANILTGLSANVTWVGTPTNAAPATTQASTTLTLNLTGPSADIPFQSQPFTALDIYKLDASTGELVKVSTITANASSTASGTTKTYTWIVSGVALTKAATNTFYVVGRNDLGEAVISNAITVTNP